jgi:hypothetical protein
MHYENAIQGDPHLHTVPFNSQMAERERMRNYQGIQRFKDLVEAQNTACSRTTHQPLEAAQLFKIRHNRRQGERGLFRSYHRVTPVAGVDVATKALILPAGNTP